MADERDKPGFAPLPAGRRLAQEAETLLSSTADAAPHSFAVGSVIGQKYRLTRFLGQGGMGTVWVAEQTDLGVPVAVKVMHRHVAAQGEYVERFRREARAALLLSHPNVVRVLDFGQHEETFYIVMEFIAGKALDEWLAEHSGLPPIAEVVPICVGVLDALEAAHRHGIVHRDLKPENVILSEDAQGRRVAKVVDFGLAHVEDPTKVAPTLTRKDMVAGTPAYMSPEQSRSLAVGPSTDLYAFGCLLTELLQGRPPFEAPSPIETISQHLFLPPPPLERPEGAEPVPPLLERLRLELLAKHPHQRPADAATARARLLEAVDPQKSSQRLPSRKGEVAAGERDARVPEWNVSAPAEPAPQVRGERVTLVGASDSLLRDPTLAAGLAAHGFRVVSADTIGEAPGTDAWVCDVGSDVELAASELARPHGAVPVLIAVSGLDTVRMRRLIEAGAADVIAHPITPDVLAKKLRRLLRRR
ncbi:MAG: serine/threonine-protein kinase [Polyangiaceae bacterium]